MPVRGRDEVVAHLMGVAADTGPIGIEVAEAHDAGDGEVLLRVVTTIEPEGDEEPATGDSGHLLTVEGDEITGVRVFLDWDEAREAAGLS